MSDTTNQQPAGSYALLIEFLWPGNAARYTNWTSPVTIGGNTFTAAGIETRITVQPTAQTGKIADEPWQLLMPPVIPLNKLVRFSAFPLVTCNIYETDPTATSPQQTLLWAGNITSVWSNPKEAPGFIKAEISGWKYLIQYPLGVESKTACSRTFGDPLCGYNVSSVSQTTTITTVAGHTISATGLTIPSGKPANYFSFGSVTCQGLSISIIDGSAGVSSLRLLQVPPPEWAGASAVFTPGCDKSLGTGCMAWGNQARFWGIGIQKPADSPLVGPR